MTSIVITAVAIFLVSVYSTAALLSQTGKTAAATNATIEENHKYLKIIDTILKKVDPGLDYLGVLPTHAATSCWQIAKLRPYSLSGLYWIHVGTSPKRVFCNMDAKECGGGVWTRIANFNMTIPSAQCPVGLEEVSSPKRGCRRKTFSGSSSNFFSTYGIPYRKVCGKIIGYQFATPDAFYRHTSNRSCHADGVLLSYNRPRRHIWTFTAQPDSRFRNQINGCPCSSSTRSNRRATPRLVGNDYFCETGYSDQYSVQHYALHPLWDGKGNGTFPGGCQGTRNPWFLKEFPFTINSDVEMRICLDEPRNNEDISIEFIQMYVQ